MKQKLLNSLRLRVCALVAMVLCTIGSAWGAPTFKSFTGDTEQASTTISGTNVSSGNVGVISWTGTSCTYGSSRINIAANGSITFTASSGNNITKIVMTTGTSADYVGTWSSNAGTVTTTNDGKTVTIDGIDASSVIVTTSSAYRCTSAGVIEIHYTSSGNFTANDLTLNASTKEFDLADGANQTFQLTNSGSADGTLSYASSNDAVATVSNTGLITAIGEGTATITVTQAASSTYEGGTATCEVTVTDSRYTVSTLTFTAAYGSGPGTADDDAEWTVTSDGTESNFDNTSGIHYGTNSASVTYVQLSTSDIKGTIKKVKVNTRDAQASGSVTVSVGGSSFNYGENTSVTATNTSTEYTFTGSGKGEIIVRVDRGSANTKAIYVKSVKVYYEPSTDPAISASDVDITYDATSGSIDYTLENATGNVSATVTTGSDWLTLGTITSSSVPFTSSANTGAERTATVTLSFSGADDKVVTVTQAAAPVVYTTIPDLFDAATTIGSTADNVNVTFGNWVVSGVSGSNAFVTDNSGNGFIIYTSNHGFAVNDKLSGTVSETPLKLYNGSAEFTNLTSSTTGLTVSNDGVVTVITNKTIADLGGVNTGAVITLSNLTYDGTNLSDGTNTIKPYTTLYNEMSLTSGKTYNVTGVYQQYGNNTKEILPRSAADIVEVQVQHNEYTLTVSNLSHVDLYVFDANDETNPIISGEGSAQVLDGTQVMVSVDVESGYVIESLIVDGNDVTSQIDDTDAYTFTMPTHAVTITATAVEYMAPTLSNANIVAAGDAASGYNDWSITDGNGRTWNAHAIKDKHSNNTSGYHFLQIKKNDNNGPYYIQVPEYGKKITSLTMTVSSTQKAMGGGDNSATLFFSSENTTSAAGEGVASSTGAGSVTIDCSSLNLNTGYITASAGVRIWDVTVTYDPISLNNSGYATYASTTPIDYSDDSEFSAWVITGISGDAINFAQIKNAVPAGTGVLLKGSAGQVIAPVVAISGTAPASNLLEGITTATTITDGQYYGLSGNTFVKVNGGTVPAGKALLPANLITESNGAKAFTFVFEGADGIKTVEHVSAEEAAEIFNLAGQRMSKPVKGVNIINGKKVLVK